MSSMNDVVDLLASTNETLKVIDPEGLDLDKDHFNTKKDEKITAQAIGFLRTTPTDFFDIIYNS